MGETIKINLYGNYIEVKKGITILELCKQFSDNKNMIMAAKVDNQLRYLEYILENNCTVEFVDLTSMDGLRIYIRSLSLVLIRAAKEIFKNIEVFVEHSIGDAIYCETTLNRPFSDEEIALIKNKMQEIINSDEKITKLVLPKEEALEMFKKSGLMNRYNVVKYRPKSTVNVYTCGEQAQYFYGYMVPSTGFLKIYDIRKYENGLLLMLPDKKNPNVLAPLRDLNKLFKVYHENQKWGKILKVEDVGELNQLIESGKGGDLIRVAEALHEKKIANIADSIVNNKNNIRLVLIAGPSSSGKTTFAQRLSIQLRVNGIEPVAISLDDYFVNRDNTPLDENGEKDYESIEALDLKLFNQHLQQLLAGEEVEIPTFNFQKGAREDVGKKMKVDSDQIIIIEGIHGLNERLTSSIPRENKFKIYVSALTQLRIDNYNRIPTTDARIIRRIVRDFQFRGYNAIGTIKMWPQVRRGEDKNIFPYQEEADVMFNSSLVYELSVLKTLAMPLLNEIGIDKPEYSEAKRLSDFLSYFVPLNTDEIPLTSIVREFVGGCCFYK